MISLTYSVLIPDGNFDDDSDSEYDVLADWGSVDAVGIDVSK